MFCENKIDWEKLKLVLGEENLADNERYCLNWAGKSDAYRTLQSPSFNTLAPCKEESVNFDSTQNLFIEAENMEALKILQKAYAGSVKMIYIDPPYNTGNDSFIYPDKFSETREEYAKRVGDKDTEGCIKRDGLFQGAFRKNSKDNGHYHSNWLSMMLPRLHLAKTLLRDDGVIFISIDDNEQAQLKLLCDEVFGAENFVEIFYIQVRYDNKSLNEKDDFQKLVEHVLIYAKNKTSFVPEKPYEEYDLSKFCWEISELSIGKEIILGGKKVTVFKNNEYEIKKIPYSINAFKETWASGSVLKGNTSGKFFDKELSGRIDVDGYGCLYKVEGIGEDGIGHRYFTGPKKKGATKGKFYSGVPLERVNEINQGESKKYNPIVNLYDYSADFGNISHEGNMVFRGGKKPVKMLNHFIKISNVSSADLILDFFAGSGTTAHAVMQLNAEDKGNRRYICVQLPEETEEKSEAFKAGFATIAEIAKERIRRAGKKIKEEHPESTVDTGFKVFKLSESNFKQWQAPKSNEVEHIATQLTMFEDIVKPTASVENMAYELALRLGFQLTDSIEFTDQVVWLNDKTGKRKTALLLEQYHTEMLNLIIGEKPQKVFALDKVFNGNDALKANLALQLKDAGIAFETF
uniref:site-specific DNA-methyltransferase n=1 Tax=Mergibacter septicus TaxID=221402 RepID=UPI00223EAA7E|nr:site-specific DNA-methyltransferase [Mergibacter septicus]